MNGKSNERSTTKVTTAEAPKAETKRDTSTVGFSGEFKTAVESAAKERGQTISIFVRNLVKEAVGFSGEMRSRGKFAGLPPAEREKAQKAERKAQRDKMKEL